MFGSWLRGKLFVYKINIVIGLEFKPNMNKIILCGKEDGMTNTWIN